MTTVGEIMSTDLVTVRGEATVAEAATVMGERRVSSALVMNEDALDGIFTERDIVRALSEHFDAAGHPISDWMTRHPVTVGVGTTVQEALDLMLSKGFRHLPITEGTRVVGMVSIRDISRATAES
jgi:CBS domain-containing protein